jgi:5-methyltetrahydropteroyltriglutamate--homocysteine methyltransferase
LAEFTNFHLKTWQKWVIQQRSGESPPESRPNQKLALFQKDVSAFPEYSAEYFKQAMMGGAILPIVPVICTAPVKYKGLDKIQAGIANLKAAAKAAGVPDHRLFLPATAPSGVGLNEYYKTEEDYFHALAAELNKEYRAMPRAAAHDPEKVCSGKWFSEKIMRKQ